MALDISCQMMNLLATKKELSLLLVNEKPKIQKRWPDITKKDNIEREVNPNCIGYMCENNSWKAYFYKTYLPEKKEVRLLIPAKNTNLFQIINSLINEIVMPKLKIRESKTQVTLLKKNITELCISPSILYEVIFLVVSCVVIALSISLKSDLPAGEKSWVLDVAIGIISPLSAICLVLIKKRKAKWITESN